MEAFLHASQHLARPHRHIVDSLGVPAVIAGHEQVAHGVDDVAAGEVRPRLLVIALGKPLDEIFEDIPHVHGSHLPGAHVRLFGAEVYDDLVEEVRVGHALYLFAEAHLRQDVLHIVGEAVDECPEVVLDVLRVRPQCLECEWACVVEGVSGCLAQEAVLDGKMPHRLVFVQNRLAGGQQAVVKTLHNRHRKNHQPILMGLVCPKQGVGYIPDD